MFKNVYPMLEKVEFLKSAVNIDYLQALDFMQRRVAGIIEGRENQALWFLEHPQLYTAGTGSNDNELLHPKKYPVYQAGRGGKYTYHGPGQRVAYVMLDIKKIHNNRPDLKKFVYQLETWLIDSLAEFGVKGETRAGRVGIWVKNPDDSEDKIAAIGIRVQKWVSFHGVAINVNTNLSDYDGIVPCGISEHGVTSLQKLHKNVSIDEFDAVLKKCFAKVFNIEYLP